MKELISQMIALIRIIQYSTKKYTVELLVLEKCLNMPKQAFISIQIKYLKNKNLNKRKKVEEILNLP